MGLSWWYMALNTYQISTFKLNSAYNYYSCEIKTPKGKKVFTVKEDYFRKYGMEHCYNLAHEEAKKMLRGKK